MSCHRRAVLAALARRRAGRTMATAAPRRPSTRDKVQLAGSIQALHGLRAGQVVEVIAHDKDDPAVPYQVQLADSSTPW